MRVFDRDLKGATRLDEALKPYEPYQLHWLTWSPEGTRILFASALRRALAKNGRGFRDQRRGRQLPLIASTLGQWSPAGSRIAFERVRAKSDRGVIVIVDLESGKERALESTSAAGKDAGARSPTATYNNVVHHWYYEGWTWSPEAAVSSSSKPSHSAVGR